MALLRTLCWALIFILPGIILRKFCKSMSSMKRQLHLSLPLILVTIRLTIWPYMADYL